MAADERPWPDLPGDLLSAVYLRSASAYDRVRFAGVCSPWRGVASWHRRLPALPLLLTSTRDGKRDRESRAYSLEDGRALRVRLPWFPWGNPLVGSYDGGWIATTSGSGQLLIVNFISGARKTFPTDGISIQKVAFSEDPSSRGCILAAISSPSCTIAFRTVGCPVDGGWTTRGSGISDITFCNGKLYGYAVSGVLVKFDVVLNEVDALVAISVYRIDTSMNALHMRQVSSLVRYIFELHGKLAIAAEIPYESCGTSPFFRVFEHVDNDTYTSHKYTWAEMTSLGDHALFLGPAGCKAVHVPMSDRRGGVEGNRIYYFNQHSNDVEFLARLDIGSCIVHCSESRGMHHLERIASRGYHYDMDHGCNSCMWLWPPDF